MLTVQDHTLHSIRQLNLLTGNVSISAAQQFPLGTRRCCDVESTSQQRRVPSGLRLFVFTWRDMYQGIRLSHLPTETNFEAIFVFQTGK